MARGAVASDEAGEGARGQIRQGLHNLLMEQDFCVFQVNVFIHPQEKEGHLQPGPHSVTFPQPQPVKIMDVHVPDI